MITTQTNLNKNINNKNLKINKNKNLLTNHIDKVTQLNMKERLGDKKFFTLKYKLQHGFNKPQPKVQDETLLDLSKKIKNLDIDNVSTIKLEVKSLFNKLERKAERKKDYFKDQRWKRAQASEEEMEYSRIYAAIQAEQKQREYDTQSIDSCVISSRLSKYFTCPHCYPHMECATCVEAPMNHIYRCIEELALFLYQMFTYRDAQTFLVELCHIIKTITGRALITIDYYGFILDSLTILMNLVDLGEDLVIKIKNICSFDGILEFFSSLFKQKQAQAWSDWFETELFRVGSNWFSYISYMLLSKGQCKDIPFLGDLMRATVEDGKRVSKDILKFSIKTVEFVFTKGKQALEFGFMPTFYHSRASYLELVNRYELACKDFLCKGNPVVYKLDFHEFVNRLAKLRDDLTEVSKVGTLAIKKDVQSMLTKVLMMYNDIMSDEEVLKDRPAPFAVYIWGATGIAKGTFLQMTIACLCSVHNKPYGPEYIYFKNNDPRYDGYKSSMHSIVFDDIGAKNDSKCPNGDPMVDKVITSVNNASAITEQAIATDKGKIPILSDFVYATSNTEGFNAKYNLTYEAAAMRRFKWYVKLELKEEFMTNNLFDYHLVEKWAEVNGRETIDFWNIHLGEYHVAKTKVDERKIPGQTGQVVYKYTFDTMNAYFEFIAEKSHDHKRGQELRQASLKKFGAMKFCSKGHLPPCSCEKPSQGGAEIFLGLAGFTVSMASVLFYHKAKEQGVKNAAIDTALQTTYYVSEAGAKTCGVLGDGLSKVHTVIRSAENKCIIGSKTANLGLKITNILNGHYYQDLKTKFYQATEHYQVDWEEALRFTLKLSAFLASFVVSYKVTRHVIKKVHTAAYNRGWIDGDDHGWGDAEWHYNHSDSETDSDYEPGKVTAEIFQEIKEHTPWSESERSKMSMTHIGEFDYTDYHGKGKKKSRRKAQGSILSTPAAKFWVDNANVLRDVDVGASSVFYKDKPNQFLQIVAANTVLMKCKTDRNTMINIRALCLGGWVYVTNYHYISSRKITFVELIQDRCDQASSNIRFTYDFRDARIDSDNDLVFFKLLLNKPKRNLLNLLYRGDLNDIILDGVYLSREEDGAVMQRPVQSIHPSVEEIHFTDCNKKRLNVFSGKIEEPTQVGDCGMPLIVFSHYGPTIVGLHVSGRDNEVDATRLPRKYVDSMNLDFGPNLAPMKLVYDSAVKTLVPERLISHPIFLPSTASLIRYGSFQNSGSRVKSHVVRSEMAPAFEKLGYKQLKDAPPMNNWRIFRKNLLEMTDKECVVDLDFLNQCKNAYIEHISQIPQSEYDDVRIIDDLVNINGMPGVDYIDKINRNTSAGFPWCKSKKQFLIPYSTELHPDGVIYNSEIMKEIERIDYTARSGCMTHHIFNTSQKDEPLSYEKIAKYGTRLFMGCPAAPVHVSRKYFLGPIRFFQRNRQICCMAVGVVAQSSQWGDLADTFRWKDRMIAGDYSKFDKKQQVCMLHAAFDIIEYVVRRSRNYSDVDIQAMMALRCDIIYALVHFDGDLIAFFGVLPSGVVLTVILNCLCNIMDIMYAYISAHPQHQVNKFFRDVKPISYGDDNAMSVNPKCTFFNHTVIQQELKKINIDYTMAEKGAESKPFITLDETTFLKRRFVYSEELQLWLAPLEEDNIVGSLMVWVMSKNLTPREQAYATMQNSIREFFFHGRKKYEEMLVMYEGVYKKTYFTDIHFPTFDQILEDFHLNDDRRKRIAQGSLERSKIDAYFTKYPIRANYRNNYPIAPLIATSIPQTSAFNMPSRKLIDNIVSGLKCDDYVASEIVNYAFGICKCCDRIRGKNLLCWSHHVKMVQHFMFKLQLPNRIMCEACGKYFHASHDIVPRGLCPACYCKLVCDMCTCENLCDFHASFNQSYIFTHMVQHFILQNIFEETSDVYDIDKMNYFRNHFRLLGWEPAPFEESDDEDEVVMLEPLHL